MFYFLALNSICFVDIQYNHEFSAVCMFSNCIDGVQMRQQVAPSNFLTFLFLFAIFSSLLLNHL